MIGYLRDQFDFLKRAATGARPNTNMAGMQQVRFENKMDLLWDDAIGPAARVAGRLALGAGILGAGYWLTQQNDQTSSGIGGAVLGGAIGGIGISAAAHTYLKQSGLAESTAFGAPLKRFGYRFGAPLLGAAMGAAIGGTTGALGVGGLGIAAAAIGGVAALNHMGIDPSLPLRGAVRAMGGARGMFGAASHLGATVAGAAWTGVRGMELGARAVLTGGRGGVQGPLDAWFPFFRNSPVEEVVKDSVDALHVDRLMARGMTRKAAEEASMMKAGQKIVDPRKFAPNPRIIRRLTGMAALFSVGAAFQEAMSPMVAPPSAYFDGRHMRHVNDLGTGGAYGYGVMGRNSSLNMNYQDAARTVSQLF